MTSTWHVEPLGPVLGAEVQGLNLAALQPQDGPRLRAALDEHQVLLIRAAGLTPEQHLALGRHFGPLERHAFFPNLGPGYEEISVLDSVGGARADSWHADESFLQVPATVTLTQAQILPPLGGDTCWVSMTAAYDSLSPPMQRYLGGLTAMHDCARTLEMALQYRACSHEQYQQMLARQLHCEQPVVIRHPRTGRKALFVNATYTRYLVGVPSDESAAVLQFLYTHLTHVRFMYRHRWQSGDMLIWDNLFTQHHAIFDYPGQRRRMHRVSVLGTQPLETA